MFLLCTDMGWTALSSLRILPTPTPSVYWVNTATSTSRSMTTSKVWALKEILVTHLFLVSLKLIPSLYCSPFEQMLESMIVSYSFRPHLSLWFSFLPLLKPLLYLWFNSKTVFILSLFSTIHLSHSILFLHYHCRHIPISNFNTILLFDIEFQSNVWMVRVQLISPFTELTICVHQSGASEQRWSVVFNLF